MLGLRGGSNGAGHLRQHRERAATARSSGAQDDDRRLCSGRPRAPTGASAGSSEGIRGGSTICSKSGFGCWWHENEARAGYLRARPWRDTLGLGSQLLETDGGWLLEIESSSIWSSGSPWGF